MTAPTPRLLAMVMEVCEKIGSYVPPAVATALLSAVGSIGFGPAGTIPSGVLSGAAAYWYWARVLKALRVVLPFVRGNLALFALVTALIYLIVKYLQRERPRLDIQEYQYH